jgi:hypothetical protein
MFWWFIEPLNDVAVIVGDIFPMLFDCDAIEFGSIGMEEDMAFGRGVDMLFIFMPIMCIVEGLEEFVGEGEPRDAGFIPPALPDIRPMFNELAIIGPFIMLFMPFIMAR